MYISLVTTTLGVMYRRVVHIDAPLNKYGRRARGNEEYTIVPLPVVVGGLRCDVLWEDR